MFTRADNDRGLTLIEVMVSVAVVGIILYLALSGLNLSPTTGQSQGLAMELRGIFSRARAKAVASGQPVGIIFPTTNGDTPIVQECAIFSGSDRAQLERYQVFRGNYPGVGIFVGEWAVPAGQQFLAAAPPPGGETSRLSVASWMPPSLVQHDSLVFLPSGEVLSNGQRLLEGEFPIVVGRQLSASAGNPATLTAANDAHTVLLSSDSTVRVRPGVVGGLVPSGGNNQDSWTLANLAPTASTNANDPVLESVEVSPAPIDPVFAAASGAETVIEAGGMVTLKVTATDVDGGPLYCVWTATDGDFSHQTETPMLFSPEENSWVSTWQWRAPEGVPEDSLFTLDVAVRDQTRTATVNAGVVPDPTILVVSSGILVFSSGLDRSMEDDTCHVFSVRYDGRDLKALYESRSTAGFEGGLAPSFTGRRVVVGGNYGDRDLKLLSVDGAEVRLVRGASPFVAPYYSRDATKVYASYGSFDDPRGWVDMEISFDATGTAVIAPSPFPGQVKGWSPDGTQALVEDEGTIWVCNLDGTIASTPYPGPDGIGLDWNGSGIFYGNGDTSLDIFNPGQFNIYQTDTTGSSHTLIGNFNRNADIAGNGTRLFHITDGIHRVDLATMNDQLVLPAFLEETAAGFNYTDPRGANMNSIIRNLGASR